MLPVKTSIIVEVAWFGNREGEFPDKVNSDNEAFITSIKDGSIHTSLIQQASTDIVMAEHALCGVCGLDCMV